MKINKKTLVTACLLSIVSCEICHATDPISQPERQKISYEEYYSPISDKGQFFYPEMQRKPKSFWSCSGVLGADNHNDIHQKDIDKGLQYHLMCQSLAGLVHRAVEEGRSDIAIWFHDHGMKESYQVSKQALMDMGINDLGIKNGIELACNEFKGLINGYVLTDLCNNQESAVVASVAAHVYNAIIVDVRDKEFYEKAGLKMKYDATKKTTVDAWHEFKDKCSKEALIVMPTQTAELREFSIKNRLFVLNLNQNQQDPSKGKNVELLKEILAWLKPNAPVLGWEQNVGEDEFVSPVSLSGHVMIPSDWSYNHSLMALRYTKRQESSLVKVLDPTTLDYSKKKNYVSFFLSDGDNIQWMLNDFKTSYYDLPEAEQVHMTYGVPVSTLTMMAPNWTASLLNSQRPNTSIIEMLGGGYYYIDTYSQNGNRKKNLKTIAERLGQHMRQHRVKVLGIMGMDVDSKAAQEAYQAYVDANDQLEGIVVLQYTPYAGGEGEIFWMKNKKGYDIPVITTKYSLWDRIHERENNPSFIADKLKAEAQEESFSVVCAHAWSSFHGNRGAAAAKQCAENLDNRFEVVNIEELIWRLRMSKRPEQTQKFLRQFAK